MEVFNNSEDKWSFYCWQTLLFFSKWDSDMDMFLPSWCHGVPPKILYKIALAPRIYLLKRESISQSFSKKSIKKRQDNNGQSRFPNSPLTCKMQSWGEDPAFPRCCITGTAISHPCRVIEQIGFFVSWETLFPHFCSLLFYSSESFLRLVYLLTCS